MSSIRKDLTPYAQGSIPKTTADATQGDTKYYQALGEQPNPAANAKSNVDTLFTHLTQNITSFRTILGKRVETVKTEFGTNFISINDHALGFVDEGAFKSIIDKVQSSVDSIKGEVEAFFGECATGEAQIQKLLTDLSNNMNERAELQQECTKHQEEIERLTKELETRRSEGKDLGVLEAAIEAHKKELETLKEELEKYKPASEYGTFGEWQI